MLLHPIQDSLYLHPVLSELMISSHYHLLRVRDGMLCPFSQLITELSPLEIENAALLPTNSAEDP
jgi:hypothetical protein